MLKVRRKAFAFCHSNDLVGWGDNKMSSATLNVIAANKKTGQFIEGDNSTQGDVRIENGGYAMPVNLVMTLSNEMGG
eukprot:1982653-Alexandrium_andersonii.AAC.1